MNKKHLLSLLLAFSVAGTAIASPQGGSKKHPEAPKAAKPDASKAAKKDGAASARSQYKVVLPVSGLTTENEEKASSSLISLAWPAWACPKCQAVSMQPGSCGSCKKELKESQMRPVRKADASAEKGTIRLTVEATARLPLSKVEDALRSSRVKVEVPKLLLAGSTTLLVQNAARGEVSKVEAALVTPVLFSTARARVDEASGLLEVDVSAGEPAPAQAAVEAALRKVGEKIGLKDVVFRQGDSKPKSEAKPGKDAKKDEPKEKKDKPDKDKGKKKDKDKDED